MTERMIRFATFEPLVITAEEYEQIERDVIARVIAGDAGPGERVLAALLRDHRPRWAEIKEAK